MHRSLSVFMLIPLYSVLSARLSVLFPIMPVRHVRFTAGHCAFTC